MNDMTISKAARMADVGVETIRFYERKGLIAQPAKPRSGGYRIYSVETVERIRFVRQAQQLGFSLTEAGELLSLRADPKADASGVLARAASKLTDVESKICRLEQIRTALIQLIATCPGQGALGGCSIVAALENGQGDCEKARPKKLAPAS